MFPLYLWPEQNYFSCYANISEHVSVKSNTVFTFVFQSDVTIVVDDFNASNNSELSVHRGQHVEVIDLSPGQPNWCYVRTVQGDGNEQGQGLVPTATLKPIPRLLGPGSRSSLEFEGE